MVSERGAANIRQFNAERSKAILPMLEDELRLCAKRKVQFKSIGMLAAFVAERCRVHRTTLLRNSLYKSLLLQYLGSQPGAASVVSDETDLPAILKVKVAAAKAELGTLRHELRKATKLLASAPPDGKRSREGDSELGNALVLLCLVLERVDTLAVDRQLRSIVDLAARPSRRVIAGPTRASAFIDWLDRHSALPFVAGVKQV